MRALEQTIRIDTLADLVARGYGLNVRPVPSSGLDMLPPYWPRAGSPQSVGLYLVLNRELMPFIGHAFVRLAEGGISGMCGEFGALDRSAEEGF